MIDQRSPANTGGSEHRYDAVVVGAGFAGMYMLHRLRGLGLTGPASSRPADGVGGTWYWNRYPGARCDVESMDYSYSFSEELQQEWEWTERYATQPEILRYLEPRRRPLRPAPRHPASTPGSTAAAFDEASAAAGRSRPTPATPCRRRYLLMADRLPVDAAAARHPRPRRLRRRAGTTPAAGRTRASTSPASASASSAPAPRASRPSRHRRAGRAPHRLPAHRRTSAVPARNRPLDAASRPSSRPTTPSFRRQARASRASACPARIDARALGARGRRGRARRRVYEAALGDGGFAASWAPSTTSSPNAEANDTAAEFVRGKIREIVQRPGGRRAAVPDGPPDRHQAHLRRHRLLRDVQPPQRRRSSTCGATPIEEITPHGRRAPASDDYELDVIVFATGFDAMTGALLAIDIRGPRRRALRGRVGGRARARYLGLARRRLPQPVHGHRPGQPVGADQHDPVDRAARGLDRRLPRPPAGRTGSAPIEADRERRGRLGRPRQRGRRPHALPARPTPGTSGANIPGKPRVFMPYVGGVGVYRGRCDEVAAAGYRGFRITAGV